VQPLPGAAHPIAAKIPPPNSQKCAYFAQKRIDKSAPECYYCTAKQNTEWYRRGHNGMDSKTNALFGSSPLKNLDFTGFFSYH